MIWILNISMLFIGFVLMEGVAWFTHRYIMHGLLWKLHKDHHVPSSGKLENNDWFAVFFAAIGIALIMWGVETGFDWKFYLGIGISIYGFAYFLVHDVYIHQRIKILKNIDNDYFRAMRRAHKIHHKQLKKEGGEAFGFLYVPRKYRKLLK